MFLKHFYLQFSGHRICFQRSSVKHGDRRQDGVRRIIGREEAKTLTGGSAFIKRKIYGGSASKQMELDRVFLFLLLLFLLLAVCLR